MKLSRDMYLYIKNFVCMYYIFKKKMYVLYIQNFVITTKNSPSPYIIIGTNICTYLPNGTTYESENLHAFKI